MASQCAAILPVALVVEDEPIMRIYAASVAEDAGFSVIEAGSASEAIKILESRPDIRVVFTDIEMPGSMDGLKLAKAIRDRWPPIEVIVTSGLRPVGADDLPIRARFFPKPYNGVEVGRVMRELVSRRE